MALTSQIDQFVIVSQKVKKNKNKKEKEYLIVI